MQTDGGQTVEFRLEGLRRDRGDVSFGSFLYQLRNFYEALNQTDRLISGFPEPTARYRIAGLSHASPATVTVRADPKTQPIDYTPEILDSIVDALHEIRESGTAPDWVDRDLLTTLRNMNKPVGKTVRAAEIIRNGRRVQLGREVEAKIDVILAPIESFRGSIKGRLEAINLHGNANLFRVYPPAGPSRVTCHFSPELREQAVDAVDQNVIVYGDLKYKANALFPDEIEVSEIEVVPPDDDLPTLMELRGLAPGATGDMDSVEFVRAIRNE